MQKNIVFCEAGTCPVIIYLAESPYADAKCQDRVNPRMGLGQVWTDVR